MEVRLEKAARADMQQMIGAFRVSQMIAGAARLRLADHLVGGPRAVHDLARLTGTHDESLYRMLRTLACLGVFAEGPERTFRLTPRADWLRSDVPHSLRVAAEVVSDEWLWRPWGDLLHTVTTGETAFGVRQFSVAFLNEYWLHFELVSVLLVVAVVAALAVIKVGWRDHG